MGKGLSKPQVVLYAVFGSLGLAALVVTIGLVAWKLTRPQELTQHTKQHNLHRLNAAERRATDHPTLTMPSVTHSVKGVQNLKRAVFHEAAGRGVAITEDALYHMPLVDQTAGRVALHPARYTFSCANSLHLPTGETLVLVAYFRKDHQMAKLCVFGLAAQRDTWHLINHVVISGTDPVLRILVVEEAFALQRPKSLEFWHVDDSGKLQPQWSTASATAWGVANGGYVVDHDGLSTVLVHHVASRSTAKHSFQDLGSRLNAAAVSADGLTLVLCTGWQMWWYQRKTVSGAWTNVSDKNLMLPQGTIVHLSVDESLRHMLAHVVNPDKGSTNWLWYANNRFVCFERAFANKFHTQGLHPQSQTPHVCITETHAAFGDTVRRFGVL